MNFVNGIYCLIRLIFYYFYYYLYLRFSYYGIRTVLYIFLTEYCELDKDTATAVYHAFTVYKTDFVKSI